MWEAQLHFGNTSRTNGQSCAATVLQGARRVYTVGGQPSAGDANGDTNGDDRGRFITDTVAFELAPELVASPAPPSAQIMTGSAAGAVVKGGTSQCRRNQRHFLRFLRAVLMSDSATSPAPAESADACHQADPSFTMFDSTDNSSHGHASAKEAPMKAKVRSAPKAAVR